jgi:hypothetical protein
VLPDPEQPPALLVVVHPPGEPDGRFESSHPGGELQRRRGTAGAPR